MWLIPKPRAKPIANVGKWSEHITPERVDHYDKYGYVIYPEHVERHVARKLSRIAIETLWKVAIDPKLSDAYRARIVRVTEEKLKVLWSPVARKCKGLDPDTNPAKGFIKPITGKCSGSYLPDVQTDFTMTVMTFETIASLYKTKGIAQLFGPEAYRIQHKGMLEEPIRMDANFIFTEPLMFEDRVMTSLVTKVDLKKLHEPFVNRGMSNIRETGTLEVLQGFHHYRRHAARYFDPVEGDYPLKVSEGVPLILPPNFEAGLIGFIILLKELHRHRDMCKRYPSKRRGHAIDRDALPYVDLHEFLPSEYVEIKWVVLEAGIGDLICWNQWLPYRHVACNSRVPRITFDLSYFKVPNWYPNSKIHEMVKSVMGDGDVFEKSAHGARAIDNRVEREMIHKGNTDEMFYDPRNEAFKGFTDYIQCVKM